MIQTGRAVSLVFATAQWFDLADHLYGFAPVVASTGWDGALYVLAASPEHGDDAREYVVVRTDGAAVTHYPIGRQYTPFRFVQPLPDEHILLIAADERGGNTLNAHLFTRQGDTAGRFLLGESIRDVQTTERGRIWVAYTADGIAGTGSREPVGAAGLVLWDTDTTHRYDYLAPERVADIEDCYAINATSETVVWCYYAPGDTLVQVRGERAATAWYGVTQGAAGFAIWQDYVLFDDGDGAGGVTLCRLHDNGRRETVAAIRLVNDAGHTLAPIHVTLRGDLLTLVAGTHCYRVTIEEIVAAVAQEQTRR